MASFCWLSTGKGEVRDVVWQRATILEGKLSSSAAKSLSRNWEICKDRQFLKTVDFPLSESKITFFFLDVPAERESYLGNMLD